MAIDIHFFFGEEPLYKNVQAEITKTSKKIAKNTSRLRFEKKPLNIYLLDPVYYRCLLGMARGFPHAFWDRVYTINVS